VRCQLQLFLDFCFHSIGSGELPISVWFGARSARVQFTDFLDRRATSGTRHGQYLFQGQFLGLHDHIMQPFWLRKCSELLIFNPLATQ
jgi:hypothetical protein